MTLTKEKIDKKVPLTDEELLQATGGARGKGEGDCPKYALSGDDTEVSMGCMWNINCLWNKLTQQKGTDSY